MTQEDVAKVLHLQPSTVGMYEQDRQMLSLNVVVVYANLFSVSADFCFGYHISMLQKRWVEFRTPPTFAIMLPALHCNKRSVWK